jgi:hypothetical protein
MTKSQLGLLGSVLAAGALAIAGCGGGGGSGGGTGGKADAGGTGGKVDGGGTGGRVDGGAAGMTATDAGVGGRTDGGADASDARVDTGPGDTGPCVTSFGSSSRLLSSFDNGNVGWSAGVSGLAYTFASLRNDGHTCPGAISLNVQYMAYGDSGADVESTYGTAADWTGFTKVHAWAKLATATFAAVGGVQAFVQSNGYANYANGGYVNASTFMDGNWHEIVFDMLNPGFGTVTFNAINRIGIQVVVQGARADGGPPAPTEVTLVVDDVWLEAAPPPDAAPDVSVDTGVDAPAADTGVDAPAADTGVDVPAVDTGSG